MDTIFGIDFGTTNSSLAINTDGKTVLAPIDRAGGAAIEILRSVIFFGDDGTTFVGQEAVERYIDDCAGGRFLRSVKTLLPSPSFTGTVIRGKLRQAEDLAAIILRTIRERGQKIAGAEVERAVIGRPVVFSTDPKNDALAEQRLREAALKAGFKDVTFQLEPIGAALLYESTLPAGKEEIVIIGDFGGGTSDFTVMRLGGRARKNNRREDVLALGGVYIGGDAFDSLIMWEKMARHFGRGVKFRSLEGRWHDMPLGILHQLKSWHLIPFLRERKTRQQIREIRLNADNPEPLVRLEKLVDDNTGIILFRSVEEAKCSLTENMKAKIGFENMVEVVTRNDFEAMIGSHVDTIDQCIADTLARAQLGSEDIDRVFITGGSSKIPLIRRVFEEKFGAEKVSEGDAFTSVAHGLGLSASILF